MTDHLYASLDELKNRLEITTTNYQRDTDLNALLLQASDLFSELAGRRFWTTDADEVRTFKAISNRSCFIDDCLSITTLETDDNGDRSYSTTWAATDYDVLPENYDLDNVPIMKLAIAPNGRYAFPTWRKGVRVTGKFGYSSSTPNVVKAAVLEMAVSALQKKAGENVQGVATITAAGVVITPQDVPATAWRIIRKIKRYV